MEDIKSLEIPGRICLMGDKVDLLGKPVIAMAINLMMRLNYTARSDDIIELYSHDTKERIKFNLGDSPPRDNDLGYWSVLYERLKEKITHGFVLEVKSDIPIGVGLSTSAAISIGFLRIMSKTFSFNLSNNEIAELAYLGENHDLGIQCGRMDQYSIAHGGITFIHTNENPRVEQLDISYLPIVVGDSIEERKAVLVLNRIKRQIREGDSLTLNAFKIIEDCVNQGKQALLKSDFKKFGMYMDIQQEQEIILETATEKILKLCKAAKNAGAYGAKQMGAGGEVVCSRSLLESKRKLLELLKKRAGERGFLKFLNTSIKIN